jgi:hypothetical protein
MKKELLGELKGDAKNVEDLNQIFVELKEGLIDTSQKSCLKAIWYRRENNRVV